ncbi:MAG: CoA-binding protein [bacterium]
MSAADLTWEDAARILLPPKTIAVVGLSDKPERESHEIASYLQGQGYRIIPVNPRIKETLGEKAYPGLRDVPERVDIVQIFRRSEDVPPIVDDAIAIGTSVVWMQTGIVNEDAAAKAEAAGLTVVMDACLRSAHRALRSAGRL